MKVDVVLPTTKELLLMNIGNLVVIEKVERCNAHV